MIKKIIFLLVVCFCLVGCGGKLSEEKIKEKLEVTTEDRTFTVNKDTYATEKNVMKVNIITLQLLLAQLNYYAKF